jgi:cilia- and flagella-associated protein 57
MEELTEPGPSWDLIIRKRVQSEFEMIEKEKLKAKFDKKVYKKNLDSQKFIKEIERDEKRRLREAEAKRVSDETQKFLIEQRQKKEIEQKRQSDLIAILDNHKEAQKANKEIQRAKSNQEDQKYLDFLEQKAKEHDKMIRQQKETEYMQQQEIQKMLEIQKNLKKQEKQKEFQQDIKFIQERKIAEEKREKERQDYMRMLTEKQQKNSIFYSEQILAKNQEKEMIVNKWIDKNMTEIQKKQIQEAREAAEKKEALIRMAQDSLKQHLETKEFERNKITLEKKNLLEQMLNRHQEYTNMELENKINEKKRKQAYMEDLRSQSQKVLEKNKASNYLTDTEKKLNKFILTDNTLDPRFQGPAGYILSQSPKLSKLNSRFYLSPQANTYNRIFNSPVPI